MDGVCETADSINGWAWQRDKQRDRSCDVAGRKNYTRDDKCARNGSPRILDILTHEGTRFATAKREENCRPEDSVFEIGVGSHARCSEFGGGSKPEDADTRKHQQDHDRNPAAKCAKAVEPFPELQPADIEKRN